MTKRYKMVKYPVKLGYNDNSGKDENVVTDENNNCVVGGWGDCCGIGGIQNRNVALAIIKVLNEVKPRFKVSYYEEEE